MTLTLQQPIHGRVVQILGSPGTASCRFRTKAGNALTYCAPPDGQHDAEWLLRLTRGAEVIFKATAPSTRSKGEFVGQLVSPGKAIVQISKDKVIRRIRGAIAKDGQVLRLSRGEKQWQDFGECYIVHERTKRIDALHCTVKRLAEELGVLADNEVIAEGVR